MKLLLDQGLPRTTVKHLQALGIAAEHVGDLGMAAATDEAILIAARVRTAVVVTLDADFHALLARSRATTPSVVRVRVEGLKAAELATLLSQVVTIAAAELEAGAAASVTAHRVRVRLLPIGG
jgi:predicted nuclease of predicted toxin-antitoxin system